MAGWTHRCAETEASDRAVLARRPDHDQARNVSVAALGDLARFATSATRGVRRARTAAQVCDGKMPWSAMQKFMTRNGCRFSCG